MKRWKQRPPLPLRVRLTVGTVAVLALALCACCVLILSASRSILVEDAVAYTQREYQQLSSSIVPSLPEGGDDLSGLAKSAVLRYSFMTLAVAAGEDCEYVLQSEDGDLYNNSGVNAAAVLSGAAEPLWGSVPYQMARVNGRDYCVAGYPQLLYGAEYTVAVVRDISATMDQVRTLSLRCVLICGGITLAAAAATALFLSGALRPVQALKCGAESIARGNYASRIPLKRRDELGALAESFNAMAEAVQGHVQTVEATSEERNLLLHALAHEMRTPVTAITGYAYALNHARLTEAQRRDAVDFIDSESRRLERLTTKLTQLVHLADGDVALAELSAADLERAAAPVLRAQAREAGIELTLSFGGGTLRCDCDLLILLLTNLFDNARKAGAGRVSVAFADGLLSVSDDGRGIPADQLDKITQPFYQGDPSRNQEGFGLGLTLCQRIAALHGGTLTAESEVGRGSVFSLRFPYNFFTSS